MRLFDFLSVPLLSFINRRAVFVLKVNMAIDQKSEMEDILNLYQKNKMQFLSSSQTRKLNSFHD